MSQVSYDGKRLIPAPLISVEKTYQTSGDGQKLGSLFSITLTGTLVAYKGSPDSTGTFWTLPGYPDDETIVLDSRLSALQRKVEALRELFSQEGLALVIQSLDGATPMRCYPRVLNLSFSPGIWVDRVDYIISLEADELFPKEEDSGFTEFISSASESWQLEMVDQAESLDNQHYYSLSHNIDAQGKRYFDSNGLEKPAWEQARDWVLPRLGFDATIALASGTLNLPSYMSAYNHVRNQSVDEMNGTFSCSETFLIASGIATEEFSVNTTTSIEGLTEVTIEGLVQGYEVRDSNFNLVSTKYDNAATKYAQIQPGLYTRAQTYSGQTLNPIPRASSIGRNPILGSINWSYNYDDRASGLIPGARFETINIEDNLQSDAFAVVGVLGRSRGPLMQDISAKAEPKSRLLNIEAIFPPTSVGDGSTSAIRNAFNDQKPTSAVLNLINAVTPTGTTQIFINVNSESWDGRNYRRSIGWSWE